jgi:hypothetical protein
MAKYVYQGRDAIPNLIEAGDYIVRIVEADSGISNGKKTNGSDTINLKCIEEESGCVIWETLCFHESIDWKIDTFVRSTGVPAVVGAPLELGPSDCISRRGHVTIVVDNWNNKDRNKIAVWKTDCEPLARAPIPEAKPDPFADAGQKKGPATTDDFGGFDDADNVPY